MAPSVDHNFMISNGAKIGRGVVLRGSGKIGVNVKIGDYVILDGDIDIGDDTHIGHHTVLAGTTHIGRSNRFSPFCAIGTAPQHPAYDPDIPLGSIRIGNNNTFREYTTVSMPTTDGITSIGDHCYVMTYCNINHDAVIGNSVKMASGCSVSGHVHVNNFSYLGINTSIHQRQHIGCYAMIGMNTPVTKHVLPYSTIIQQSFSKVNELGLRQHGISRRDIEQINLFYRDLSLAADTGAFLDSAKSAPILKPIVDFWHSCSGKFYLPDFP